MSNRILYTLGLLLICIVIFIVVYKVHKKSVKTFTYGILILVVFIFGSKIIELNTLEYEVQQKVQQVSDVVGTTYIKTSGSDVLVKINEEWVNLSKVSILRELSQDIVLEYDGEEIYVGHSGLYNTIKEMENLGLIK